MARRKKSQSKLERELEQLTQQERELEESIERVKAIPKQLEFELKEKEDTLPAPDNLIDVKRSERFEQMASRGEIRNERRSQGASLLLFFLLLCATLAVISWIIRLANS